MRMRQPYQENMVSLGFCPRQPCEGLKINVRQVYLIKTPWTPSIFDDKAFFERLGRAKRFQDSMRTMYSNSPRIIYEDFDACACGGYQALFPLPKRAWGRG